MQPKLYIDEQTGERFYNVQQAAQIVQGVSQGTMWNWAAKGVTSFGFELDVQREPITHHRTSKKPAPLTHRESRMLISEAKVFALKEILEAAGRKHPRPWSRGELATLEAVARRRASGPASFHQQRPPAVLHP